MRTLLLSLLLIPNLILYAQTTAVQGKIIEADNNIPITGVLIHLVELEKWTTSDANGDFIFNEIKLGEYTLQTFSMGYVSHKQTIKTSELKNLVIKLKVSSYSLDEITVLETKGEELSSSTKIGKDAIEHVQPSTLNDIMQLIPGSSISNSDLSNPQYIQIRDIKGDVNSSSGTAIIIDGISINNDANMQTFSTARMTTLSTGIEVPSNFKFPTTIGNGIDLRSISTDRIESIEVITGIPSVTYGNLTSGAIVVKTKSGYTPWEAKLKSDPKLKLISLNKGFRLKNGAFVNAGIDYTNTYKDLRSKFESYDRITALFAYSTILLKDKKPLSLNIKFKSYSNIDKEKTDHDAQVEGELFRTSEKGAQFSIEGKWALDNKLISNINYNFSGTVAERESYQKSFRTGGIGKISLSTEEGENEGIYLPSSSLTELTVKGLPYSFMGQIYASKSSLLGQSGTHKFITGIEYRLKGNNGEGRLYDIANPPSISTTTSRPRSYKNIPNLASLTAFIEEKVKIPINQTMLNIQVGARFNNFQPQNITKSKLGWFTEPRANVKYVLLNKKTGIKHLAINGGIGINYKSPSLMYLYPDKAYIDLVSLDHYTGNKATEMVVFNTHIFETTNSKLKPSRNIKKEVGLDFKMGIISANITAYYETLSDGFGMLKDYQFLQYNKYDDDVPKDEKPIISTLPFENKQYIHPYSRPTNNKKTNKSGIEYTVSFKKFDALLTKLSINGAWKKTEQIYSTKPVPKLPIKTTGGQYEYVGMYPAGQSRTSESMNTNLRFVTHSTKLRLILTTTINLLWYQKYYFPYYNETPLYLYNKTGDKISFSEEITDDIDILNYVKPKSENYYKTEKLPFIPLCNIRLTKELGQNTKLSFYANNFINHRPLYRSEISGSYTRRNSSIYFGAELKISIK